MTSELSIALSSTKKRTLKKVVAIHNEVWYVVLLSKEAIRWQRNAQMLCCDKELSFQLFADRRASISAFVGLPVLAVSIDISNCPTKL